MPPAEDYYEILQVSPNADPEVIDAAFRRLALKWHPDRRPSDSSAPERMNLLNTAYGVLSNPEARKEYDLLRKRMRYRLAPPVARDISHEPPPRRERPARPSHWSDILVEGSRNQPFVQWFIVLSVFDLLVTYALFRLAPHFIEANPLARLVFRRWNILGMTIYKFAIVMLVVILAEVIERHRPTWGRVVLIAGCGATLFVVVRGLRLYTGA